MPLQAALAPEYLEADPAELLSRIEAAKERLGRRLLVLGHHYQCDEIIRFADVTGDSFKLARAATERPDAEFIVFCGVHFMAESADILTGGKKIVILPDLSAGCSMADMADIDQAEEAFEALTGATGAGSILPVTYINSSAAIKAFVGRNGGSVCTSSNAEKVYRWALGQKKRLLFLPDQHLGRNVGHRLGIAAADMAMWDPALLADENLERGAAAAPVVLWKGHCSVHGRFTVEDVKRRRQEHPGIRVISHPECTLEVVLASDDSGSTEKILREVDSSPAGSKWAVGTEIHLVHRLAARNPGKLVVSLSGISCLCSTMYRIDPPHLLAALEDIERGRFPNRISVPPGIARDARVALDRMLTLA